MSVHKEKQRGKRWMLIYAVTLGEVALFTGSIAKRSQLRWWTDPMKFSPLLFAMLRTWRMMD